MSPPDDDTRSVAAGTTLQYGRDDATWRPSALQTDDETQQPLTGLTFASPPPPAARRIPVQGSVDRRIALDPAMVDVKVSSGGKVLETLRVPVTRNYGPSPA